MAHRRSVHRVRDGSMHGTELGSFVCAAGKERVVHLVSMHAVIIASGSLTAVDGKDREDRAMQTLNFQRPEDLAGTRVNRRCRDCTLAVWQTCRLPKKEPPGQKSRQVSDLLESVLG